MKQIPTSHIDLVKGSQRVCLSTVRVDGHPQLMPVRGMSEAGDFLLVIERGSPAERNIRNNTRISILVYDSGNPWYHMEIRGEIVEIGRDDDPLPPQMGEIDDAVCVRMTPKRIRVEG